MEMTREILLRYRSNKQEIKEQRNRLQHLCDNDAMVGNDVIFDYRTGYPLPQSIVGFDHERHENISARINNQIARLQAENDKIEEFIYGIQDSLTRRIFQLYFLDGMTQKKVSKKVHLSQSRVSEKISDFLGENEKSDKIDKKVLYNQ